MSEIDLIPASYRNRLWHIELYKRYAIAVVLAVGLVFISAAALSHATKQVFSDIRQLQTSKEMTARQQLRLKELGRQKQELDRQLQLLEGLRGGATAEAIIRALDNALTEDNVWFLDWEFYRDGVVVEEETINTGYFVVVPQGGSQGETETWQIKTHMAVKGQVIDHNVLSLFVKRLFEQDLIDDVRVIRTSSRKVGAANIVDFNMVIVVNNYSINNHRITASDGVALQ